MPALDDFGRDVDIFVTFRCGLRCTHCFMGDNLGAVDMPLDMFRSIVGACARRGTKRVTLLGGEPTLYPHLVDAIAEALDLGLACRIVTNGQRPFQRVLNQQVWRSTPYICFSIDGSTPRVHDAIRGRGSFDLLVRSLAMARNRSVGFSGIVSVSKRNVEDVPDILRLCSAWGMDYVNVHYVTNRGYGRRSDVLDVDDWLAVYQSVTAMVDGLGGMEVRIEETFGDVRDDFYCAVRSRDNLMFLPDGRVFHCMLFIDVPDAHSYRWEDGLVANASVSAETLLVGGEEMAISSCPALPIVNAEVASQIPPSSCAVCIYKKQRLTSDAVHQS